MPREVVRTKADSASNGSGLGASLGPLIAPWPCVPWHCQQPNFMNKAFPFSAEEASAMPCATRRPATNAASLKEPRKHVMSRPSARLRDDIHQGGLAGLHYLDRLFQRRPEVVRIVDGTRRPYAHRFGERRIVDVRIEDRGAHRPVVQDPIPAVGYALHVHHLLVVAAVVVHHVEDRDVVMRRSPED